MAKEVLTHSDRYVRKTNRIILIVGIITLLVFLFGLMLLTAEAPEEEQHYEVEDTIDAESDLGMNANTNNEAEIEFDEGDEVERPITLTPNPINMGQVVLGNDSTNVLTIGTNGKSAIKIISVDLEEAAFEGFSFESDCKDKELRGKITCNVTMKWKPTIAANVQNNFKVTWRETNVSDSNAKHDEVPVYGSAVHKEDCNFCEGAGSGGAAAPQADLQTNGQVRYAVGPDGKIIGVIGEDGLIHDQNGNEIGRVNADGMTVDKEGNIIGVASTGKLVMDENGNVSGYVDAAGVAHDNDGKTIGTMMSDGTIIGESGKVVGKAIDVGYVYDENGNIIGRVLEDGTVVDLDGNVIGRVDENGNVIDKNGNIIGHVAKSGDVALDDDGNRLGVVMPNGEVVDENGDVVGFTDENDNVFQKQKVGTRGSTAQLVYDENGNVIGYVDEDGNVRDFNGNIIGRVDENGNVIDTNGKIIGRIGKDWKDLAVDENGNAIGYIDEDGIVHNNDDIVGYIDKDGNIIGDRMITENIGKVGTEKRLAYDKDGNVIGYIDDDGTVYDFNGNVIGHIDENGNIVDENGNVIGHAGEHHKLVYDENGNVIGYVDENGTVHDMSGKVIGRVDKNGNAVQTVKEETEHPVVGKKGAAIQLAYDENGNVIGYIDEDGNVRDFNGNIIGRVDENGNVIDSNGKIIGRVGEKANLALDKNGNIMGWVNNKNVAYDKSGKIIGISDKDGNIRAYGIQKIGSLLDKMLLPITPDGKVLGELNNRGEIISQNKVVGKMRPSGLVTDKSGAKIIARGIHSGYIANWGCNYGYRLDRDGIVRHDGAETSIRIYADGTAWTDEGQFAGKIIETGSVYDDECNYIGEANADGYVRDSYNKEVGCLNPDGSVLDLEKPQIKGHIVKPRVVMSTEWQNLGVLEENGTLRGKGNEVIGCVNHNGEVFDKDMAYLGKTSNAYYAYDFNGKLLGTFDKNGKISIPGQSSVRLFLHNLIANRNNKIIGFAAPEVNVLIDAQGNIMGHLFPDGNVYDAEGEVVDRIKGAGIGLYGETPGKFLETGYVVDMDGQPLGFINYDLNIISTTGNIIGKSDAKGRFFDETGRQLGGIVHQGGVRGYNGAYLGYVVASGDVVELEDDNEDGDGNPYRRGDITGRIIPDGHIVRDGRLVGEVLPESAMVDLFGSYIGYSNAHGVVVSADNTEIAALLPGGVTNNNISAMPKGLVIDFGGHIIGEILPDGRFMNVQKVISGNVMADGKVVSSEGRLLGEVVSGDIVIGNDDKVKGFIGFDGKVYRSGSAIGKLLTDGLAVDNQNNILGHVYNIGNTVLSNNGDYAGRLAANGKVVENINKEIGFMKSNGSFIDADKNVAGYLLPEVAKNRRN